VNDPVDRLLDERQAMDRGMPGGILLSLFGHLMLVGGAAGVMFFSPHEPPLQVMDGFVVPLPPGGLGPPSVEPAAPAAAPSEPAPSEAPAPPPEPPKVLKPPKEEPRKGLPEPDAKRVKARPEPTSPPRAASSSSQGAGAPVQTPGFEFGPPGPGVPGGTDMMGDWYLAGVQRKVWTIWIQQIKANFAQPITVQFTILADGSLDEDIRVLESGGVPLLDLAAKRAIYNAAPFGPLPKHYGTNRFTIQGVFKPAP
jgi:periplasmic protein TonB